MAFIYGIQNQVNGKWYIGKTRRADVSIRWNEHINALNAGKHVNNHLQNAWKKYGFFNFDFRIISEYPVDYDEKQLADAEIKYIDFFDSYRNGYNLTVASIGDEEPVFWKYTVVKRGFAPNGKQQYCIHDRDNSSLIRSIDKDYLVSFLPLLNSDEEAGLKAIRESNKFKYTVAKRGFNSTGKQQYCICDRDHSPLIQSINKSYLNFVVGLLNSNESDWVFKENGKFKLKNKKLLKELYKNYDSKVLV